MSEQDLLASTLVDRRITTEAPKTLRFAFYGRVSTDDTRGLQDREVSKAWQLNRATQLIKLNGIQAEIITEFFDEGVSRTVPLFRRPEGARMLNLIAAGKADFHAVIIGEAKRIFAGQQLEDVYYLLAQKGIELWIPEVSGRYDDNNISHKMLLAFEGIIGKAESDTVRGRVRDSMEEIAKSADRRWLGGNAPYGYKLALLTDQAQASNSSKGFTQTLAINEDTAPIVRRIFDEYINGASLRQIASGLTADGIPTPTGKPVWVIGTLSTLLDNHTYTGRRAYGKQRKQQVPYDPSDPRLGTKTARTRRGSPPVISRTVVYPAIITEEQFLRVFELRQAKRTLTAERTRKPKNATQVRPLQGRIYLNGKKMVMDKNPAGTIRYRLKVPTEGKTYSVYEWQIREVIDLWLSRTFARNNIFNLLKELKTEAPRVETKVRKLTEDKVKKQRAAQALLTLVEEGDEQATERYRLRIAEIRNLETQIAEAQAETVNLTDIYSIVRGLGAVTRLQVLQEASDTTLLRLYEAIGLHIDYLPETHSITVNIAPTAGRGFTYPSGKTPDEGQVTAENTDADRLGSKVSAPGGTRTPNPFLRTELLFH